MVRAQRSLAQRDQTYIITAGDAGSTICVLETASDGLGIWRRGRLERDGCRAGASQHHDHHDHHDHRDRPDDPTAFVTAPGLTEFLKRLISSKHHSAKFTFAASGNTTQLSMRADSQADAQARQDTGAEVLALRLEQEYKKLKAGHVHVLRAGDWSRRHGRHDRLPLHDQLHSSQRPRLCAIAVRTGDQPSLSARTRAGRVPDSRRRRVGAPRLGADASRAARLVLPDADVAEAFCYGGLGDAPWEIEAIRIRYIGSAVIWLVVSVTLPTSVPS